MILNGITEFVTAPDLVDRSIILPLRHVSKRRTESSFWAEFENMHGRIFGALLDLMVNGVRDLPTVQLANPARMADFVAWCVACGLENFEEIYQQNLLDSTLAVLDGDPLASGIKALMRKRKTPWVGTASQLADALKNFACEAPGNMRAFSVELRKLEPALRTGLGITVEFLKRRNDTRPIQISSSLSSFASRQE
jgi:hypothetical protein